MQMVWCQAGLFAEAGVVKVRLTGGEPTLRRDLVELVGGLRALPGVQSIGLTTNGLTLSRKLAALQSAGMLCSPCKASSTLTASAWIPWLTLLLCKSS
jgi:uncharacterized radical SAM superfamily Fe-S cluster-containing enzyme